jgi:hypothetical protein
MINFKENTIINYNFNSNINNKPLTTYKPQRYASLDESSYSKPEWSQTSSIRYG